MSLAAAQNQDSRPTLPPPDPSPPMRLGEGSTLEGLTKPTLEAEKRLSFEVLSGPLRDAVSSSNSRLNHFGGTLMFGRTAAWRKLDRRRTPTSRRTRRLEVESLESRTLMSFTPLAQPDASYLQSTPLIPITALEFSSVTSLADNRETISFSDALEAFSVPNSWATWAAPPQTENATPRVLYESGTSVTLSFDTPVHTFGVEMEPNIFDVFTMSASFYNDGNLVGTISMPVNGFADARLFAGASTSDEFTSVVLSAPASAEGFALAAFRYGGCRPGVQVTLTLPASNFILPPVPPKLSLPTIHLAEFNATFTVQSPAAADQGAICSATGNTDTNGGVPTRG